MPPSATLTTRLLPSGDAPEMTTDGFGRRARDAAPPDAYLGLQPKTEAFVVHSTRFATHVPTTGPTSRRIDAER